MRAALVLSAVLAFGPATFTAVPAFALVAPPDRMAGAVHAEAGAVHEAAGAAARIPGNLGWESSNWAGYAVGGGPYTSASGQWVVPTVDASPRAGFSALWVGVDGFSNRSLIQAGTEADFYNGSAHYSAWWEILPAPAVTIPGLRIGPGDRISVTIARVAVGRWQITVKDAQSGTYSITRRYGGPATSAEWIEEAPVIGFQVTRLATHGTVVFGHVTVNGRSPHLATANAGAMIRRGHQVETPSAPTVGGNGFALAEQAIPPPQPAGLGYP